MTELQVFCVNSHGEAEILVTRKELIWVCSLCKKPVAMPDEFKAKKLRLDIGEEKEIFKELEQEFLEDTPIEIASEFHKVLEHIYSLLILKIMEKKFPHHLLFTEVDRLELAFLALRSERR